ncbi:GM15372 [Drosophila sechellia]|uniref:GD20240 n=2 Tax=melanogaster subgroup TaxID=32351 RepID=B4QVS4_DROSI|nr:GM15372 [Drosophila sechellia]EDX12587.1 GD20240 [Drosophila simulans]
MNLRMEKCAKREGVQKQNYGTGGQEDSRTGGPTGSFTQVDKRPASELPSILLPCFQHLLLRTSTSTFTSASTTTSTSTCSCTASFALIVAR